MNHFEELEKDLIKFFNKVDNAEINSCHGAELHAIHIGGAFMAAIAKGKFDYQKTINLMEVLQFCSSAFDAIGIRQMLANKEMYDDLKGKTTSEIIDFFVADHREEVEKVLEYILIIKSSMIEIKG